MPDAHRMVRQALQVDRLLGADATPIREIGDESVAPAAEREARHDEQGAQEYLQSIEPPEARGEGPVYQPALIDSPRTATHPVNELEVIGDETIDMSDKREQLESLAKVVSQCSLCTLCRSRTQTVFGVGNPNADLMFIGEGPGADEDRLGEPFVGRAGQLLDKQIAAMGLKRQDVYIANIVKCRPPGNRVPTPEEAAMCTPYLECQIKLIKPRVIIALGATAAKYLLQNPRLAITRVRGTWFEYCGIPLMPTFHPAYLLRQYTVENRGRVWSDLKDAMRKIGLKPPGE